MSPGELEWEDWPNDIWPWRSQELRHVGSGAVGYRVFLHRDRQQDRQLYHIYGPDRWRSYEPIEFLHALLQYEPVTRRGRKR